ncbi:MAG: hypothetical protein ACLPID_05500 [Beijerinckiaceae bacterium]
MAKQGVGGDFFAAYLSRSSFAEGDPTGQPQITTFRMFNSDLWANLEKLTESIYVIAPWRQRGCSGRTRRKGPPKNFLVGRRYVHDLLPMAVLRHMMRQVRDR